MKKRLFLIFLPLLLLSCKAEGTIENLYKGLDLTPAAVMEYALEDNQKLHVTFSETVDVTEVVFGKDGTKRGGLGKTFSFSLPITLSPGEEYRVSMTVMKDNGVTSRFSFLLVGRNNNTPRLLINEVSVKGTSSSPDRIEIYVLSEGDTAGMTIGDLSSSFSLPSLKVRKGDLILIYWDKTTTKKDYTRDNGRTTFVLNARASSTLPGTEGAIVLRREKDGEIIDVLLYSEKGEDSFQSEEKKTFLRDVLDKGLWEGNPFDSSLVTSSRVIARYPGALDTDTDEDFFITQARQSTFGEENAYLPYTQ